MTIAFKLLIVLSAPTKAIYFNVALASIVGNSSSSIYCLGIEAGRGDILIYKWLFEFCSSLNTYLSKSVVCTIFRMISTLINLKHTSAYFFSIKFVKTFDSKGLLRIYPTFSLSTDIRLSKIIFDFSNKF